MTMETVVNISSTVLSDIEVRLLQKGLSFCPSSSINWFDVDLDMTQFFKTFEIKDLVFQSIPSE